MRQIIASTVNADKQEYNEGILGRPNDEYCAWILQPESWGGAIEVSILSAYHGIEFDVVDITNAIINRFGEDKNYGIRAFLLFDGIHYDPLYLESTSVSMDFIGVSQNEAMLGKSWWPSLELDMCAEIFVIEDGVILGLSIMTFRTLILFFWDSLMDMAMRAIIMTG